jgi:hypothetical protein
MTPSPRDRIMLHASIADATKGALEMITCHLRYVLDPTKIKEFERTFFRPVFE